MLRPVSAPKPTPAPANLCSQPAQPAPWPRPVQTSDRASQQKSRAKAGVCSGRWAVPFTAAASESRRTAVAGWLTVRVLIAAGGESVEAQPPVKPRLIVLKVLLLKVTSTEDVQSASSSSVPLSSPYYQCACVNIRVYVTLNESRDKNLLVAGSGSWTGAGLAGLGAACDCVAVVTGLTALTSWPGSVVETLLLVRRQMSNKKVRSVEHLSLQNLRMCFHKSGSAGSPLANSSAEIKAGEGAGRRWSQHLPDSCRSLGHSCWRDRGSRSAHTCPGTARSSSACSLAHTPARTQEEEASKSHDTLAVD